MILINNKTKEEIHLLETDNLELLKNQLFLLGLKGLAYSKLWNDISLKIEKLKGEK